MQILLIGNPISGHGKALGLIRDLVESLQSRGHKVEEFLTRAGGDANRHAREISAKVVSNSNALYDCIVVAGGDGTLNEVVNGLSDPSGIPIALLPCGTANLLARELKLPFSPVEIADMVTELKIKRIDMGIAYFGNDSLSGSGDASESANGGANGGASGGRRFLMVASCGFDSLVIEEIERTRAGTLGFWGYPLPILRVMEKYVPPLLRVTYNKTVDSDSDKNNLRNNQTYAEMVVVGNIRAYAGFFVITENADCCSGELDVCIMTSAAIVDLVRNAWFGYFRKGLSGLSGISHIGSDEILIESGAGGGRGDKEVPVQLDGDLGGFTPVRITLEKSTIPIVV